MYFAGEHTNFDGRYQSLDGAYNTGTREAERIAAEEFQASGIAVLSGIGARDYYRKEFGYILSGYYMVKHFK